MLCMCMHSIGDSIVVSHCPPPLADYDDSCCVTGIMKLKCKKFFPSVASKKSKQTRIAFVCEAFLVGVVFMI